VSLVAKRHKISEQTIYTWRKRFGGFQASEVRRLKQLEAENARLKKLVAERDLEIEVVKEVAALVSVPARRFKAARSALSYQGRKAATDAPMVERMRELSVRAGHRPGRHPQAAYRGLLQIMSSIPAAAECLTLHGEVLDLLEMKF
jgi:hypothetical protein